MKIQISRLYPKLFISRNSKLPSKEVIPKYYCQHVPFGPGGVIFSFLKKDIQALFYCITFILIHLELYT